MPPWLLVTPASRGIGFGLSRALLRRTTLPLVATTRGPPDATREALLAAVKEDASSDPGAPEPPNAAADAADKRLHVLRLDVTDEASIAAAAARCQQLFHPPPPPPGAPPASDAPPAAPRDVDTRTAWLHAAFLLPGILQHPEKSPAQLSAATLLATFRVNAIGPLLLMKHFAPFLPGAGTRVAVPAAAVTRTPPLHLALPPDAQSQIHMHPPPHAALPTTHATLLALSARLGSVAGNTGPGGWYGYRASKAALNQAVRTLDRHLARVCGPRAAALAYHPGTVATALTEGRRGAVPEGRLFSVPFAVQRLLAVARGFEGDVERGRGRCWDWRGVEVPP